MKQCKIYDSENKEIHGGILMDNGDVICACCGGLIEADEFGDGPNHTHKILEIYEDWIDFTYEICGQ